MSSRAEKDLDCALKTAPEDARLLVHERKVRWVVALTLAMMIGELLVGYATNSLALTADGWHMGTHVAALGLSAAAYWFARTRAQAGGFSFGTGKVHALAGYSSALLLALVAVWMAAEAVIRLLSPEPVAFAEALPVAILGLVVNLASMKLLHTVPHGHGEDGPGHGHGKAKTPKRVALKDHNLRAAYIHVLTDALTSVLAIAALIGGHTLGWNSLDAAMGIIGGVVILHWSYGLIREAAKQLLDVAPAPAHLADIQESLETRFKGARVVDLHVWEIGPSSRACIVSLLTNAPRPVTEYRDFLKAEHHLTHVTVEVHVGTASS